jgi:hypothetical protein
VQTLARRLRLSWRKSTGVTAMDLPRRSSSFRSKLILAFFALALAIPLLSPAAAGTHSRIAANIYTDYGSIQCNIKFSCMLLIKPPATRSGVVITHASCAFQGQGIDPDKFEVEFVELSIAKDQTSAARGLHYFAPVVASAEHANFGQKFLSVASQVQLVVSGSDQIRFRVSAAKTLMTKAPYYIYLACTVSGQMIGAATSGQ